MCLIIIINDNYNVRPSVSKTEKNMLAPSLKAYNKTLQLNLHLLLYLRKGPTSQILHCHYLIQVKILLLLLVKFIIF